MKIDEDQPNTMYNTNLPRNKIGSAKKRSPDKHI
jgi:hypothetical protein